MTDVTTTEDPVKRARGRYRVVNLYDVDYLVDENQVVVLQANRVPTVTDMETVARKFNELTALADECERLRHALEPFTNNGRVFIYHRNVEHGDYFECLFCNREGPKWREVPHNTKCLIAVAQAVLGYWKEQTR